MTSSSLLRAARKRAGLSQGRLALRAGTSQDAISRIERGVEEPGVERLRRLLAALGEELVLSTRATGTDPLPAMSAAERLRESASWNLAATKLELAGAEARKVDNDNARRAHA